MSLNKGIDLLCTGTYVPVIDISSLLLTNVSEDDKSKTVKEISDACEKWGFFYIRGHQIPMDFIHKVQRLSKEFFKSDKEYKNRYARTKENFRGYSDNEFTKRKLDWKEVFDFGSEISRKEVRESIGVDGENRWPDIPEFKSTLLKYADEMHDISKKLMWAIFEGLGVNPSDFENDFRDSRDTSMMRVNFYPICPNPTQYLGVGPHADPSALTILWQDLDVNSLQVEKNGQFYPVTPVDETFVVNIGDMTQVWSNGKYKAPVHRVLANHKSDRYSNPFFFTPSYDCMVKPLETCISETNPCRYRPINWGEFRKGRFEGDYADVGEEIQIKHYEI